MFFLGFSTENVEVPLCKVSHLNMIYEAASVAREVGGTQRFYKIKKI